MIAWLHLAWTSSIRMKMGFQLLPLAIACGRASARSEVSSPMSRIALVFGLSLNL